MSIRFRCERGVHSGEGFRVAQPFRILERCFEHLLARVELFRTRSVVHPFAHRGEAVDVEDEAIGAAAGRNQLHLRDLLIDHFEAYHQHHRCADFFHDGAGSGHPTTLIEKVLPIAAQTRHRIHEADLCDRLLDGILSNAHLVAQREFLRVVIQERIEGLVEQAAQAFAVAARSRLGCRFGRFGRGLHNRCASEQDQA